MSLYVDELFDEISRLPADRQEDAIASRCAGAPSVEREIRALLSAHSAEDAPTEVNHLEAGAELDHYRLEEQLGSGATASVWRAWDTRLEAYTALKLLDPAGGLRGQRALNAVMHEARAASGIISDHVVRIKTAGRFVGGPHFVEMELCAERRPDADGTEILEIGRSLSEVPLRSVEEKVRVVAEAARGVDAAHRVGVLHRDLKPGNILLTPVSRRAKVVDFGLAAEHMYPAPGPSMASHRTVTVLLEASDGRVVGTPAYMPPEQAFGHPPTRATDVYALGATLYALLTEDHPYVPRPEAQVPALDVLDQVREGPPARLRRRAKVPRRLERIVARAMERSARDRYATAGELADDLDAWRAGFTTRVDGAALLLGPMLFLGRHRTLATTLAIGLVSLALFAVMLGWLELQRRDLQSAITGAQEELTATREMAERAAEQRNVAESEAEEARRARNQALEGESNAQRLRSEEFDLRKEAELRQEEADLAREQAERARDEAARAQEASEAALRAAETAWAETRDVLARTRAALESTEGSLDDTRMQLQIAMSALETRTRQLAAVEADLVDARAQRDEVRSVLSTAESARTRAEDRVRLMETRLGDLQSDKQRLTTEVQRQATARSEAEAQVGRLRSALASAVGGGSDPDRSLTPP